VTASQNIRAIVIDPPGNVSPIADFPFMIKTTPPPAPVATPDAGTYNTDQAVTLESEPGATFHDTTNGTARGLDRRGHEDAQHVASPPCAPAGADGYQGLGGRRGDGTRGRRRSPQP
jgi:hypothetical protein